MTNVRNAGTLHHRLRELRDIQARHVRAPVQKKLRETEHYRSVAAGLSDILSMLNRNRTEKEVLSFVCKQATAFNGASAAAVYRFDEEAHTSALLVGFSLPTELAHIASVDLSKYHLSVTGGSQPLLWPNWEALPVSSVRSAVSDLNQENWLRVVKHYFAGLLGIPIKIGEKGYGVLFLFYSEPRVEFSRQVVDVANVIGEQASLAVENSYLRIEAEQAAISTERARLARDLHDSVTQILFSASLIAEVLPRLWEKDHVEGLLQLAELRSLTKGALAEMRGLLFELRPTALLKSPLPETLRPLVEGAGGRASIPIILTIVGDTPLLPEIKVAFYRITQEALNNVVKHANAENASVTLERHSEWAELCIMDNGRGFAPESVAHDHLGLNIMYERAQAIGAQLRVDSQPGQGTRITVIWHRAEMKV